MVSKLQLFVEDSHNDRLQHTARKPVQSSAATIIILFHGKAVVVAGCNK